MLSTSKVVHAEDTFYNRDYVRQLLKLQHMYVIGLIFLSAIKTTKHPGYILLHTTEKGFKG